MIFILKKYIKIKHHLEIKKIVLPNNKKIEPGGSKANQAASAGCQEQAVAPGTADCHSRTAQGHRVGGPKNLTPIGMTG